MRYRTLTKVLGLGFLAVLICAPVPAQQQDSQQSGSGDPVADAARKAREQKKDGTKAKKVITDDDIVTKKSDISVVGTAPTDASTDATKPAETKAADSKTQEKEDPNSEKAWRARFDALRTKIATAEQELNVLQREENKADVQYYSDPTKALKEQYSRDDINKKAAKIDAKQKEIAALKQQWDDLEVAMRKAGGEPGWAR